MALERYLKMSEVEDALMAVFEKAIDPALKRVVEDSSMPWDDAAYQLAAPMIKAAIAKIHDENAEAPQA